MKRLIAVVAIAVTVLAGCGSADSGFAIYDLFRFSPCPIVTVANGVVASAAVLIFLSGQQGKRLTMPNARFLLHQPLGGVRGQASDITIEAEEILKMRARLIKEIAVETGQPYEKVVADTERNFWMGAEEAVKYGLVGKVVTNASEV